MLQTGITAIIDIELYRYIYVYQVFKQRNVTVNFVAIVADTEYKM